MSLHLRDILVVEDMVSDVELMLLSLGELKHANDTVIARDRVEGLGYLYLRGRFASRTVTNPGIFWALINEPPPRI